MKTTNHSLIYTIPRLWWVDKNMYLASIKTMILDSLLYDPTIILHSDQEILDKYAHSVIALDGSKIIWNVNLYPTHMQPLDSLVCPHQWPLHIGELWSVVVDVNYRNHWVWTCLVKHSLDVFAPHYDAVVSATINDHMDHIFRRFWFENIPFPHQYFEEGKQYLWPKMPWWIEEFTSKAQCFLRLQKDIKQQILEALLSDKLSW
jgi:hypothetical protein